MGVGMGTQASHHLKEHKTKRLCHRRKGERQRRTGCHPAAAAASISKHKTKRLCHRRKGGRRRRTGCHPAAAAASISKHKTKRLCHRRERRAAAAHWLSPSTCCRRLHSAPHSSSWGVSALEGLHHPQMKHVGAMSVCLLPPPASLPAIPHHATIHRLTSARMASCAGLKEPLESLARTLSITVYTHVRAAAGSGTDRQASRREQARAGNRQAEQAESRNTRPWAAVEEGMPTHLPHASAVSSRGSSAVGSSRGSSTRGLGGRHLQQEYTAEYTQPACRQSQLNKQLGRS